MLRKSNVWPKLKISAFSILLYISWAQFNYIWIKDTSVLFHVNTWNSSWVSKIIASIVFTVCSHINTLPWHLFIWHLSFRLDDNMSLLQCRPKTYFLRICFALSTFSLIFSIEMCIIFSPSDINPWDWQTYQREDSFIEDAYDNTVHCL